MCRDRSSERTIFLDLGGSDDAMASFWMVLGLSLASFLRFCAMAARRNHPWPRS